MLNIVLFAIVGELGAGKTLTLTYLAWNNWFHKYRKVYSNYHLYGFPYTFVQSLPDLEDMKEGFFVGDELWLWIDSWQGKSEKQRLISAIILKSRKRSITIAYTTQSIHQVVKRIRDITDFVSYPMLSLDDSYCRTEIFRGPKALPESRIKPPIYFNTEPVFAMFNSYEEVKGIKNKKAKFKEIYQPVWENPAWKRYFKWTYGKDEDEFMRRSREIQKAINPDNTTLESQREDIKPEFQPI